MSRPRRARAATVALVESPVQLLHLIEWSHARDATGETSAIVLAPTDEESRNQLRSMVGLAAEESIRVAWHDARTSAIAALRCLAEVRPLLAQAERIVVGDPFSGLIQALVPVMKARKVVVIDDGTATMEFVGQLATKGHLTRWDAGTTPGLAALVRMPLVRGAQRFFTPGGGRQVEVFTVMPLPRMPGLSVEHHRYDWTRRRFGPPRTRTGTDIIGTSLVESGVVDAEAYLDAVTELAVNGPDVGRYFAHRREDPSKLRRLAQRSGLEIVRPAVPIEIEMRRGPVARRVVSFPSSVGYTLPQVLAGVDTTVAVLDIVPSWIRRDVDRRARKFLTVMAEQARARGAVSAGHLVRRRSVAGPAAALSPSG